MANILKVSLRQATGKTAAKDNRNAGNVPAVIYARGEKTRELLVGERDFRHQMEELVGKSPIIDLQIGDEAPIKCIVKMIQRHSVSRAFLHVDFQKIHANEKVTVNVPIHLEGSPIGIKMGGLLDHALREVPVRGLPEHLPANITLDITNLKMNQSLHVSDIKLANVEIQLPGTTPVASVLPPKAVEEVAVAAAPVEGEEAKEPEVIAEKKTEERAAERAKTEAVEGKGAKPGKEEKKPGKEEKKPEKKEEKKK